jgi:hypothetical protein
VTVRTNQTQIRLATIICVTRNVIHFQRNWLTHVFRRQAHLTAMSACAEKILLPHSIRAQLIERQPLKLLYAHTIVRGTTPTYSIATDTEIRCLTDAANLCDWGIHESKTITCIAARAGIEPATSRLTAGRSAAELPRNVESRTKSEAASF